MSNQVSIGEEPLVEEERRNDSLAIGLGAVVGAAIGGTLVWAYRRALIRQAQEGGMPRPLTAVGFPDLARVALSVLGLLRQLAELGG